jgi:AcrR family transcriptional regulator
MPPEQKARHRASHQLPPGRHGLSRRYVQENQRQRILDAVADVVSLAGYQAMSVEDVVSTAGVSRRTFYDHFSSKDDAFLTAYDAIGAQLVVHVRAAYAASTDFAQGVISCLAAFLEFVASEPHYADMCIVEAMAAGPAAIERRNRVMQAFAQLLHEGAQTVENSVAPPALVAETIVGGIYEIVYARVLQGKTGELPALLPDLAYSVILPYLGPEAAEQAVVRLTGGTSGHSGDASAPSAGTSAPTDRTSASTAGTSESTADPFPAPGLGAGA